MDIYAKLREILCQQIKRRSFDIDAVTPETKLNQLGLDSLDTAELVINIEEEFELPEVTQEEMMSIETVKDLKELIERKKA
ncbi:MAG: phosphopantetheine-binding protein [Candidatus Enterosoma sp.]|nr:phosphopantetheine-binding protein [Bacilli bacterium]MDD6845941.1 phosphopantetheine-binding protein [bacterium]MDY2571838.1 phosphopantetheine-binding protein [Candidatus Enterosoma sp.]MCI7065431.1 phosphopantetheine-binding protein [Bacilli bacterium]MDD7081441.1 phosphopantetheine-binding protein [bacterium]